MRKKDFDEKDIDELVKLKNEIDEKIKLFNQNASPKSIEKLNKRKNKSNIPDNLKDDFSQMNKRQQHKTARKLNFLNKFINILNKI